MKKGEGIAWKMINGTNCTRVPGNGTNGTADFDCTIPEPPNYNKLPPTPKSLTCNLPNPSVEQYADGPPICVVVNRGGEDINFAIFYPKVDDFSLLILDNSFNETWDQPNVNESVFVRVEMGQTTSSYRRRAQDGSVAPFFTMIFEIKDGTPTAISWDDGCFGGSTGCPTSLCYDKHNCAVKRSTCIGEKHECDLKFYAGWFGTDKNGRYLVSAGRRLSRFRGYSLNDAYDAAKDVAIETSEHFS